MQQLVKNEVAKKEKNLARYSYYNVSDIYMCVCVCVCVERERLKNQSIEKYGPFYTIF